MPDGMMDKINEFRLFEALENHKKVAIGYSAGALVQLSEYYLSPDADYSEFNYYKGIPYINDFYIQPHYEGNENQIASINRILSERKKPVYATHTGKGAVVVADGKVKTIGEVSVFRP
jgi:peptidase E